ncbi:Urease accessory protein UreD [Synechococcus sp. MIT S9509]|uniref:urease accessory protein UreD n=1 Tax=unclassified Synechococcus TaxID=2626047 RepID=UPI0007BB033C|nr:MULTISPECIES: urease accessory protein UreD [unclassified Synechococcus]KZR84772.1 Urease accessory protein UreD [Synechococcus sp. MIT S9504]KZR91820.1 Urease accessory protein UreD [Synechococcus sp. MIT S9509]
MQRLDPWQGHCRLKFIQQDESTIHQGGCSAPFKLLRAEDGTDGRREIPLLHTAGGLVGGDQLNISLDLEANSRSLITSVAAQKVYGSIGRSRLNPQGSWARQEVNCQLSSNSDLEWLPQELVVYANALYEQQLSVRLPEDASFLGAEIVRLGRTAAGETLQQGRWRSSLSIQRVSANESEPQSWELVDRLELGDSSLQDLHGLHHQPVFGTLIWAAPIPLCAHILKDLVAAARDDREGLEGTMRCGGLQQGFIARYAGPSSRDARFWFSRIWRRTRLLRNLNEPKTPRVWPLQEQPLQAQPLQRSLFTANHALGPTATH